MNDPRRASLASQINITKRTQFAKRDNDLLKLLTRIEGRRIAPRNRALLILLGIALSAVVGVGIISGRGSDDPLASLPRASAIALADQRSENHPTRVFQKVTLSDASLGRIVFTVSLPDPLPTSKLPLVIILGGLGTRENSIRSVDPAGENAVIGYGWPLPTAIPKGLRAIPELPSLRRSALSVPGQVTAMLHWLIAQPWSDAHRISLIGFSLGAIAVPAVDRVAQQEGLDIQWTVLAYGGVGLDALIEGDQRIKPGWVRPLLGTAAAFLLKPLEPADHLPRLSGQFLILGASSDTIVDKGASAKLEALTPEPKTIIHTAGDHIGTGRNRQAQLEQAMATTRRWLIDEGAVNPVEP
jgi:dienelactone hydrolase